MANIIREGEAICKVEPRGDNGLEGYQRDDKYRFQYMDKDKNGKPYYRVYPESSDGETYYETCGPNIFREFFSEYPIPADEF